MQSFRYLALVGAVGLAGANAYAIHMNQQTRDLVVAVQGQPENQVSTASDNGTARSDSNDLAQRLGLLELQFREGRAAGAASGPAAGSADAAALADLRQVVDDLQRSVSALAVADDDTGDTQVDMDLAEQATELEFTGDEDRYDLQDRMAHIGDVFESEPEDPDWSRSTKSQVHGFFSDVADDGIDLGYLDCRATLCEMVAVIRSDEAMAKFDLEFAMRVGAVLPSAVFNQTINEDGSIRVQAFLAREGEELPSAEAGE